jgi:hypothetical protein
LFNFGQREWASTLNTDGRTRQQLKFQAAWMEMSAADSWRPVFMNPLTQDEVLAAVESTVERLGIGALRAFLLDETVTTGDLQKAA